jgi:hypothetical protein
MAGIRRTFGTTAILSAFLVIGASSAFATDLGRALQFGVLSTGKNIVLGNGSKLVSLKAGGTGVQMQRASDVSADVIANPGGIVLGPNAAANTCVTAGAKVKLGKNASCTVDTSGSNPDLSTLSGAITDAATYATDAASQMSTRTLSAVKIGKNGTLTIMDTVSGFNVISIPSINIANGGTLTFAGASGDTVLLLVARNVKLGPKAALATSGFPDNHLLILASGGSVTVGRDSLLTATVLAPSANCVLGVNATTRGAFICGNHISLNRVSTVDGEASAVTLP